MSIRQEVGESAAGNPQYNLISLTSGKTGFHLNPQRGNRAGFNVPQPKYEFEMSKKGDALICTTTIDIENDVEREIIKNWMNNKLDVSKLEQAPQRGRKPNAKTANQTAQTIMNANIPSPTIPTPQINAPTEIQQTNASPSSLILRATADQIIMANAILANKAATSLDDALSKLGVK